LSISFGGHSTKGKKVENQDAFALKTTKGAELELKGHIAVIADGVSSANFAAKASQMSVMHFIEEYLATPHTWSVEKSASSVLSSLNNWLYARQMVNTEQGDYEQWLTTFSALIMREDRAHIFHVGDCEIVKINSHGYQVLTKEHSAPNGMLERALGASKKLELDVSSTDLDIDDILMLSCDGVFCHIKPKQIREIISAQPDLEKAATKIVELALEQGSIDNLTCLLVRIDQLPKQAFNQLLFTRKQQVIPPAMPVGAKLDHFEILDTIDQSARSHIYLAKDLEQDKLVVIKAPSMNFNDDNDYIEAFIKEGWIGDKVNHPAVMKISSQEPLSKFLYHVCQHVTGQTVLQWFSANPKPSLGDVRDIATQIVTSLRALQRNDVTHGDIKPDNFMIDSHGRVTLIDLGSCEVGAMNSGSNRPLGTLTYSAPERFYGLPNTSQSDLFSVGVLIYQMLCDQLPFKEITNPEKAPQAYNQWRYRPIKSFRKDMPDWLDVVLSKALAPDPANRYSHYSEFMSDLNAPQDSVLASPAKRPLVERDPVKFWQTISFILFIALIASLFT